MIGHQYLLWIVTLLLGFTGAQDTGVQKGCTFYDDQYVYNIQLSKGNTARSCQSPDTLNDKFKATETKTLETSHQVMQLQGTVLKLMQKNVNLTRHIDVLEQKLRATKEALKTANTVEADCPAGYTVKNTTYKSCYMFVGRFLNWYDAEAFCMSTKGHLVALETMEEQEFLVRIIKSSQILPGQHFWTGGNDIAKEDQWMWAGINVPFNYTRWLLYPHPNHGPVQMPDNHKNEEHCVHMFHLHNYDWNDLYCGQRHYFICETKLL